MGLGDVRTNGMRGVHPSKNAAARRRRRGGGMQSKSPREPARAMLALMCIFAAIAAAGGAVRRDCVKRFLVLLARLGEWVADWVEFSNRAIRRNDGPDACHPHDRRHGLRRDRRVHLHLAGISVRASRPRLPLLVLVRGRIPVPLRVDFLAQLRAGLAEISRRLYHHLIATATKQSSPYSRVRR